MRTGTWIAGIALMALGSQSASAQFSKAWRAPAKVASPRATAPVPGGLFQGSDDCNAPHTSAGVGDQLGVPFNTGSGGTSGQNEAGCYFFGTTGIDNDVWYDWTADQDGNATLSTCGGTTVDTKIAAWPDNSPNNCPLDSTSLACNDDDCGFQSTITWLVNAGSTYTLQIGTFPGAPGGGGTFDLVQSDPLPCGTYDDGVSTNALTLNAGGELGWMHAQACLLTIESIETAYGTPGGISPPNGGYAHFTVYEDEDCDLNPNSGPPKHRRCKNGAVTNAGTDILNSTPLVPPVVIVSQCSFVMATADQLVGELPAPMDENNPTPNAWAVGSTLGPGTMNYIDINNNTVPPMQMEAINLPTSFLLRATGTTSADSPYPPACVADSGCPCGNNGDGAGGCNNSAQAGGAQLIGSGNAFIGNDTLVLNVFRSTNQPGIFFQGDNEIAPPPVFGDGFRCCGNSVLRIGTYLPADNETNTGDGMFIGGIGGPISQHPGNAGLQPGDSRCYQWWYRDPSGPCGSSFNLSNSVMATWQ